MERYGRIVLGYHGCVEPMASRILSGEVAVADWKESSNPGDWLGNGIYFWEHSHNRALQWAEGKVRRDGEGNPAVIGAVIQLGVCLDLTDQEFTRLLSVAHKQAKAAYRAAGKRLPRNRGPQPNVPHRDLDCLVINWCATQMAEQGVKFQTVRCPFLAGVPAYPGAKVRSESHIQVAVRDKRCIIGVFRPTF